MYSNRYNPEPFVGPPVGWFGRTERLPLAHPSMTGRWVNLTEYPEGLTSIHAIGERWMEDTHV